MNRVSSRRAWLAIASLLLICGTPRSTAAQGAYQFGSYPWSVPLPVSGGYIDAADGNLHLEIPIASIPGRGHIPFVAKLVYDSHIWAPALVNHVTTWQPNNVPNSTAGWRLITSADTGTVTNGFVVKTCMSGRVLYTYVLDNDFVYHSPEGHTIPFGVSTTDTDGNAPCAHDTPTANGVANDASGYQIHVTNYIQATIFAPDGTQLIPRVEDTNGNYYSSDTNGNPIDTLGRIPILETSDSTHFYYNVLNSQNLRSEFTLTTTTIQVCTGFGQAGVTEDCNATTPLTVVSSIGLPDGTSYTLNYDSGTTAGHYGVLTSMQLPTGNTVGFAYSDYKDAFGNQNLFVASHAYGTGTWAFSPLVISSCGTTCSQQVTVQQPSGDHQVYTFSMFSANMWNTETIFYQGVVSSSNILGSIATTYITSNPPYIQPQTITSSVPMPGGTTLSKQLQASYDTNNLGNVVNSSEWGFYTGTPPATPYRKTSYTYLTNSDNNMVNKKTNLAIFPGSSQVAAASTQVIYDGTPVSSVTGVTNHDDLNFGVSYNARGNPTSIIVAPSITATTSCAYDMTGQPTQAADANSNITKFGYANNFFDDSTGGPNPHSGSGLTNAYPTAITMPAPLNWTIGVGFYWGTGQFAKKTDQNGAVSTTDYVDAFDRPTRVVAPVGWTMNAYSATQVNTYLGIGDTTPDLMCSSCRHNESGINGWGQPVTQVLVNDPEGAATVTASYDSSGRLQSVTNPERAGSSPTDGSDTYTYDGLGRILSVSHSAGGSVQTYYGANVTTVGGNTTQLCASATYGLGYPTLVVDEAGKKREVWTDGFGRPVEVDEPNNSGALTQNTCYSYDVLNNLIGVTQGTQSRSYGYDASSRLVVAATPESGTVNYYYTTSGSALCSGNPGAVCRRVDARGITTNYSYDTLNRLTGITYAGGSPVTPPVTYSYDAGTNQKGFRTGMTDGSGSTAWTYNSDDWILSEQRTIAGKVHTISYSYNQDGTIAAIVYPSGRTITYTTNNAERATSAKDVANGIQYAVTASYAPIGALTAVVYGPATGFTGIAQSASYNSRLETTAVSASSTAGTPENLAFNYGTSANNGSIVSIQNNVIPGLGVSFTYDPLNRIVSGATTSSTAPGCWGQSFGTAGNPPDDQWSNLTQINSTQCSAGTLNVGVTSSTNRLSATGYAFDAAGNMTADSLYTYTYDAENHLMQATGMSGGPWTYTYDGNGLRAEKSSPSGGTLYWRSTKGGTIAESDLSGNITNEYVLFAGKRVAQRTGAGNSVYYYYLDQIGNTIAITTQTGTPCYQATFAPYGQEYATQATCSTNYKFTGYERDSETGLDYAFARYYNSRLARFMSADPVAGNTADPQTWNRYAYVGNNPPNRRDPLGLFVHDCSWTGTCMGFAPGPSGSGGGGCSVDGVEGSCGGALGLNGTAACPNNQCQLFYNGQYYAFQAFADGSSGYLSSQAPPGWSPSDIAHAFTIVSEGQGTPIDPSITLTGQAAAAYDALAAIVNQEDITVYQTGSESFEAVLTDAGFDQLEQSDVNLGFWDAALHYPYTDGGRDDNTTNSLHFVWFDENLTNSVGGSGVYMQFHIDSFNPEAGGFLGHARCVLFHIGC